MDGILKAAPHHRLDKNLQNNHDTVKSTGLVVISMIDFPYLQEVILIVIYIEINENRHISLSNMTWKGPVNEYTRC